LLPAWLAIAATAAAATITAATASSTAAAAATITITAAAAAASATKATASATTTAITAIFARTSFIDSQIATVKFLTVKLGDSCLAFFFRGHLHKAEATRTTGITVFNNGSRLNCACLGKQLLQILARSLKSEIANVKFHRHLNAPLLLIQECQKKLESKWLRCNGSSESSCSDAQDERLLWLKSGLLSNHPKRRRQLVEARGASPLMRERRD
jgi:hypothetical protein